MSLNGGEIPKIEKVEQTGEKLDASLKMSQVFTNDRTPTGERTMAMNVGQTLDSLLSSMDNVRNMVQQNPKLMAAMSGLTEGHEQWPVGTLLKTAMEIKPGQDQAFRTALLKTLDKYNNDKA